VDRGRAHAPSGPSVRRVIAGWRPTVVEVGPQTVRALAGGSGHRPDDATVSAALDGIDDEVVLLGERPVLVADLWRVIMASVLGRRRGSVIVLHPSWWPPTRVNRVIGAVAATGRRVTAKSRSESWVVEAGRRRHRRPVLLATATVLTAVGGAVLVWSPHDSRQAADPPVPQAVAASLLEGRIVVQIPEHWIVERITGGPGSRRVQVSSPTDVDTALQITQSYAPESTLAEAAGVLGRLVADQPPGVFVEFRPIDEVAGRPAVTYREVRAGRVIRWSVVLAGSTRISIGCQSAPGREDGIGQPCERAVASAREVGTVAPGATSNLLTP